MHDVSNRAVAGQNMPAAGTEESGLAAAFDLGRRYERRVWQSAQASDGGAAPSPAPQRRRPRHLRLVWSAPESTDLPTSAALDIIGSTIRADRGPDGGVHLRLVDRP